MGRDDTRTKAAATSPSGTISLTTPRTVFHQHYGTDNLIENNVWAFGSSRYCDESAPGPHLR